MTIHYVRKQLLPITILFWLFMLTNKVFAFPHAWFGFTPPPIPPVNTADFSGYVQKNHTFPSPYGYEPYRDQDRKPVSFLLNELNQNPYIPVTFYCNSNVNCPLGILYNRDSVQFLYPNNEGGINPQGNLSFKLKGMQANEQFFIGFYYPNDPKLYNLDNSVNLHPFDKRAKKGDPLVTILFSQRVLQQLSAIENGNLRGYFIGNNTDIKQPAVNGKESLTVGTTLSLIGLGEASGVLFSETISQTTGETYTKQVQTGFDLNVSLENQLTVGGGEFPVADSIKYGVNKTLSLLVMNGLEIADLKTISRTYTIKPGINDTYYWAIYQLLYSYRISAPLLTEVFKSLQTIWLDKISITIGDNQITQDNKMIGNLLPPQSPHHVSDITVGVAVPMENTKANKRKVFSQILT